MTSRWDYIDFELEIREGSRRRYPVSVRSPAGEAQEQMRFPFDEWELENKLLALENTLLRSGGSRRRIPAQEEQPVQEFGQSLLQALLVGEVRTRYEVSLLEAKRQNKGLRLKLRIHPPELARLPWEFLYDPERDEYISLSDKTPMVRYLDLQSSVDLLPVSSPLKILGMVASPSDLPELDVEHEKRLVEQALKPLRTRRLVELSWLEGQTWDDLQQAMWGGPWHIFHFIGHGVFDKASEEGCIVLSDEAGNRDLLGARNLARLVDGHYQLRLVFLNSCEGAKNSVRDAFSGTAATLVRRGIPAVVAMQYEITDEAAISFARTFYRALARGLPVDASVAAGRTAISMKNALEWGTPVLYMRSPDGCIFDISIESPPPEPTQEEARDPEDVLRQYREGVESIWAKGKLDRHEAERLGDLANRLGLNPSAAADVEREVIGETIEATLKHQERAAREEERRSQLEALYARAHRLHHDQEWQAVVDLFEQMHMLDSAYPDPERLLVSAREELAAREDLLRKVASMYDQGRQYMEAGEWQQALKCFEEVQRLEPGYKETEKLLSEVRHKEERRTQLDELYTQAGRLHQDQRWQQVAETFNHIHALDPEYPDPEGLLASAREALKRVQKEQDALNQYRKSVESAWAEEGLDRGQAEQLEELKDRLGLSPTNAANIERKVMGNTLEAVLERQERTRVEEYRKAIAEAWADRTLDATDVELVSTLLSELGLSEDTAAEVERQVMDDTLSAILERQKRVAELYDQARQLYQDQEWQAVVNVFEQIHVADPEHVDPEGLLVSAREELAACEERARRAATLYDQGYQYMDDEKWAEALECFEEVQRLEPDYRDTGTLLSQVRDELASAPQTVEIPDLSGQSISQARGILHQSGLKLGNKNEISSETVPERHVIRQSPEAGTKVESGSLVNITFSSGRPTVKVPNLTDQRLPQARSKLASVGLKLGSKAEAPSETVAKGKIIKQDPSARMRAKQGSTVHVTVSSGAEKKTTSVPDVSGKSLEEAKHALSSVGLVLGDPRQTQKSSKPKGTVISTDPSAGSEVDAGTLITPLVSSGPRRSPVEGKQANQPSPPTTQPQKGIPRQIIVGGGILVLVLALIVVIGVLSSRPSPSPSPSPSSKISQSTTPSSGSKISQSTTPSSGSKPKEQTVMLEKTVTLPPSTPRQK